MKGSVGQMLRDARLEKNLTVEDVSRATKIRPPRIDDLENDDYSRFPNLAYARSFLFLYAKHLGVDISQYPTVEPGSAVGLGDYQYLQNEESKKLHRTPFEPVTPPGKPRWLIAFFVFLAMLAIGAYIGWIVMNYLRLSPVENRAREDAAALANPAPGASATPAPTATPESTPTASPTPEVTMTPPLDATAQPPTPSSEPEVRRAEPVLPAEPASVEPVATPAAVFPPPGAVRELKLRVTKRTRVRILRDKLTGGSVYYGYVNPAQPTLTFKGKYFWIKAADPDALSITIDGQPATGPESGVEIVPVPGL